MSKLVIKTDLLFLFLDRKEIMLEEKQNIGYYAIIPAAVLYNDELKPNQKILYAVITSLSNKEGYCYATNKYLAEKLGVEPNTVSSWITDLKRKKFMNIQLGVC